jgi:16S rRNA G527 N7-methylase RsmG
MRVFSIAINAASGETDSNAAVTAVARAEESLFTYSLNYHSQDVLDLVLHFTEAQCAADAVIDLGGPCAGPGVPGVPFSWACRAGRTVAARPGQSLC